MLTRLQGEGRRAKGERAAGLQGCRTGCRGRVVRVSSETAGDEQAQQDDGASWVGPYRGGSYRAWSQGWKQWDGMRGSRPRLQMAGRMQLQTSEWVQGDEQGRAGPGSTPH
jgi:hypothetical protein